MDIGDTDTALKRKKILFCVRGSKKRNLRWI